jgi:aconitate hydratase
MNSFNTKSTLQAGSTDYTIFSLEKMAAQHSIEHLPVSLKILLENLLRKEDDKLVTKADIQALCNWQPTATPDSQISFMPARVVLQDFTGVPAVVDLAVMRDAMAELGGDPQLINPLIPVDLVIDHSVMVDYFAQPDALQRNTELEFERNRERYQFLRWGQQAFDNFRVVPPGTGIVHQVNLEYLASVVSTSSENGETLAYPDTLVGTDSHTTMINGLGVLGWGVGGIEAEAAMLGQPVSMLIPQVVGFKLEGQLPQGATATDLVLTVVEMLRQYGVVGKFVEFYGDGLSSLPLANRATIGNMAPEYGATCGLFPVDQETIKYLTLSGRDPEQIALVEAYARAQGLWRNDGDKPATYSDYLSLNLADVVPSIAGPKRPQDRIALSDAKKAQREYLELLGHTLDDECISRFADEGGHVAAESDQSAEVAKLMVDGGHLMRHGDVVIAAITSCTNTSNPEVMLAAGLLAKKARERGLLSKPWVKTSLAPGSQVVPAYLENAGLLEPLKELGFDLVGFGCTTCIGNSGPLPENVSVAIRKGRLNVCSVLSGNRNFEGRIHQEVQSNYLASPPLVVAYALAGSMLVDLTRDSLGKDASGKAVYLKDIWPSQQEINDLIVSCINPTLYRERYADVFKGDEQWQGLPLVSGKTYSWPESTYVKKPPYFTGITGQAPALQAIKEARCLVKLGDSITTDHISPAGAIHPAGPAGHYLLAQGVEAKDFNSLGSRRGNHEVMMRGTFANNRLRNQLAPGTEGGFTTCFINQEVTDIYAAAMRYKQDNTPLIVLAGKEYGTGSSRDWAAKGAKLLGIEAVIAASFERIHRSNLVGFGVLPLEFMPGEDADTLGLQGNEIFTIDSVDNEPESIKVHASSPAGAAQERQLSFAVRVRIDTPAEWDYYRHGGILHFMLRQLAGRS